MRLSLYTDIADMHPAGFDFKAAGVSIYANEQYAGVAMYGVTPAQLHDAIGCTNAGLIDDAEIALLEAWTELDAARVPNITKHCRDVLDKIVASRRPTAPTAEIVSAREGYEG